jgi:hypothetical protein
MTFPKHIDERAKKFFDRVFVGKLEGKHGEDEYGYKMSWDSRHEELKTSKHYRGNHCAYCGNRPFPIQPENCGYEVTGYTCICKDAQDEIEIKQAVELLEIEHEKALRQLKSTLPEVSVELKRKLVEKELKSDYYLDKAMKALGIK